MIKRIRQNTTFENLKTEITGAKPGTIILNANGNLAAVKGIKNCQNEVLILGYEKDAPDAPIFWYHSDGIKETWCKLGDRDVSIPLQTIRLHMDPEKGQSGMWEQLSFVYKDPTVTKTAPTIKFYNLSRLENQFMQQLLFSLRYKWPSGKTSIQDERSKGIIIDGLNNYFSTHDLTLTFLQDALEFDDFWKSLTRPDFMNKNT